jgi:hypothetical protein
MTLSQRQRLLAKLLPRLIDFAYEHGYEITLGDAYRDPRVHGPMGMKLGYGHKDSNHKNRLAVDLNLFKGGVFLQTTADHSPLGTYWEGLNPLCKWGGRFNDGNHYSIESPDGMK